MSLLCYGWMKFKVESGSPTKTPRKLRSVCTHVSVVLFMFGWRVRATSLWSGGWGIGGW